MVTYMLVPHVARYGIVSMIKFAAKATCMLSGDKARCLRWGN